MAITLTDNMQTTPYLFLLFFPFFEALSQKYLQHLLHYQYEKQYSSFSTLLSFYQRLLLYQVTVPRMEASYYLLHHIALYQKLCPLLSQNLVSRNKSEFLLFLLRVTSVAEKCLQVFWVTQKSNLLVFLQLLFVPPSYSILFLRLRSQSSSVLVQDLFCS